MKPGSLFLLFATLTLMAADKPPEDALPAGHAQRMARGLEIFQQQVRPILAENCVKCHGGEKTKGEFDLTTREGLLKGGADGPDIKLYQAKSSLLYKLITHAQDPHMPSKGPKLPDHAIAQIAAWIDNGAPYDKPLTDSNTGAKPDRGIITDSDRQRWAFQPLQKVQPPKLKTRHPAPTVIDAFILARLETNHLELNPASNRRTLIRRASFDLLGVPPSPGELDAFLHDSSRDAWPKLVARLLASPRYGERWARHWLDVARFAESSGFEHDYDRPNAYHYRDWVIQALNADMPYDQFVRWQLAGDEFEPDNPQALIATGFLGAGVFPTQITANEVERTRYDALDDMLATTGTAMLGMTIGCARCHDHKFDPIPTRDYYRMLATFTTTVRSDIDLDFHPELFRHAKETFDREHSPLVAALKTYEESELPVKFDAWIAGGAPPPSPSAWELIKWMEMKPNPNANFKKLDDNSFLAMTSAQNPGFGGTAQPAHVAGTLERLRAGKGAAESLSTSDRAILVEWWKPTEPGWQSLHNKVEAHARLAPKPNLTKVLVCAEGYPPLRMHTQGADFFNETYFLQRGSTELKKGVVTPGFLQVLARDADVEDRWKWRPPPGAKFSGRRRSLANWMTDADHGAGHLLARVIVNRLWQHHFGQGLVATPNDFGAQGAKPTHPELIDWLASELIRSGWRLKPIHQLIMSSAVYQQNTSVDPAKLAADPANALLSRRNPGRVEAEAIRDSLLYVSGVLDTNMFGPGTLDQASRRRSIYFTVKRSELIPAMQAFDAPEPLASQGYRQTTTVAPQALWLMNNPHVRSWAAAFAGRLAASPDKPWAEIVARAYSLALNRAPTKPETADAVDFITNQIARYRSEGKPDARELALTDFAQVVLSLNEFIYVD